MEFLIGFLIATAVGLTGVGAGSLTAPVLILFFHLKPAVAVGTALTFAAIIKFAVLPVYLRRQQVNFRILGLLCLGGVPGVLIGIQILKHLSVKAYESRIFFVLGITVLILSIASLYRTWRFHLTVSTTDRSNWLPLIAAFIGAEVGFSSAGAGALGAVVLLNLTKLTPALVVGTDMVFGLVVSTLGSGLHILAGNYDQTLAIKLCVGGVAGALLGAWLSTRVPSRPLRFILSFCLIGLGLQLCWKALA
jgi:uncharacterized membrane protein YfcA